MRKGKQILTYNFDTDLEWRCEGQTLECDGSFHISDINQEDMDFEITALTVAHDSDIGPKARNVLKKCAKDELIQLFRPLNDELKAIESDSKKLDEDKVKREANAKLVSETREATGAEKDRLL